MVVQQFPVVCVGLVSFAKWEHVRATVDENMVALKYLLCKNPDDDMFSLQAMIQDDGMVYLTSLNFKESLSSSPGFLGALEKLCGVV